MMVGMPSEPDTQDTQVDVNHVVAALQQQIAEQALRIAVLEARLLATVQAAGVGA
jgi:hypothetical protein